MSNDFAEHEELSKRLPNDAMRTVFHGALEVSRSDNPIRGNLFAAGMREVLSWLLQELAPDKEVQACPWYRKETKDGRPTRAQRQRYMAQGGLPDAYVEETLKLDTQDLREKLRDAFGELHEATHVRERTIVSTDQEVGELVGVCMATLADLLNAVDDCREQLLSAVANAMHDSVTEEVTREAIAEIDEKATHHFVEDVTVEEMTVERIDAQHVWYRLKGSIEVELQYGSGSDFRNGDGATVDHSFPFVCAAAAAVSDPSKFEQGTVELKVEDGGWYE